MKIGKSEDGGVGSSRVLFHVAVGPHPQQLGHQVQHVVGRVDILAWTAALRHPEVDELLLEVARNAVVAHYTPHEPHHDRRVCVCISSLYQSLQQALHELHLFAVDLDAGVGEAGLEPTHITPALYLCLQLDVPP